MSWLPLYIDAVDVASLLRHLNADEEIAFLVADGPGRWIARRSLDSLADGTVSLWHIPSGPLPLVQAGEVRGWRHAPADSFVADPWGGWTGSTGRDRSVPWFGGGHPGVIDLHVRTWSNHEGAIGLSSFTWIANRYRCIGNGAAHTTERWWTRLRKLPPQLGARKIPRAGPIDGDRPEVWAFPAALARISTGVPRALNPW